ncbi:MAG: 16S rRNA (guanine(527)-N(7))-methyltransferase RsmG [Persicimonas sp.]
MTESVAKLADFCAQNDLPWSPQVAEGFAAYLGLLGHFNKAMNLIGPLSEAEIVDGLLIDSATAAAVCAPARAHQASILDVGSGAGLPGIPLKLLYPDCPLTLVEPRRKRATFLNIAKTRLGLDDVTIEQARIEDVPPARYDYVISKAFQPPLEWLETASEWVSDGGVVMCLTRPGERKALEERGAALGLELVGACDDTTALGAPRVGDVRGVYGFGPRSS